MLTLPVRRPWRSASTQAVLAALLFGACMHDWQEWLPVENAGGGTNTGTETGTTPTGTDTGTSTGTFTGIGGAGGNPLVGECPGSGLGSSALIKVATPQSIASCVDETEVTKGQYQAWLATSPSPGAQTDPCTWNTDFQPQDASWPPDGATENLPVFGVDWCDARAYCNAAGKRLCGRISPPGDAVPTGSFGDYFESEWYNACTEMGAHTFPYVGNYDGATCNGTDAAQSAPVDVGSLTSCVTTAGAFDMSGNVWEWENSCSGSTGSGDNCRVRGGAWNAGEALMACNADLLQQRSTKSPALGFRCCADAEL